MSKSFSIESNNDITDLYNLPTLNISRSQSVSLAGIRCLNLIGAVTVTLETNNLSVNQQVVLINTSGSGATVQAAGTTIGGQSSQAIKSGSVLNLIWNGTSLEIQ